MGIMEQVWEGWNNFRDGGTSLEGLEQVWGWGNKLGKGGTGFGKRGTSLGKGGIRWLGQDLFHWHNKISSPCFATVNHMKLKYNFFKKNKIKKKCFTCISPLS